MRGTRRLKSRIESIMDDSGRNPVASFESALFAVSRIYGAMMKVRRRWYERGRLDHRRLPCTVVSVGNLTVGGTGKTPMTLYIAEMIRRSGLRVAVVSRGYGGRAQAEGRIVSDGGRIRLTADDAGDEPVMMASRLSGVPVIVGKSRYDAGLLACRELGAEAIVLDDAFQHLALKRDLDILLMDGRRPIGNGLMFPRGRLREPISAIARADAVVLTRSDGSIAVPRPVAAALTSVAAVFHAVHRPVCFQVGWAKKGRPELSACESDMLRGLRISAFSGIADNEDFHRTLGELGCRVDDFQGFTDHHRYTDNELDRLTNSARLPLVTTEKDFARISHRLRQEVPMFVVGVDTDFGEQAESFADLIKAGLRSNPSRTMGRKG